MGYHLVYNKCTGKLIELISEDIDTNLYYVHYDDDFKSELSKVSIDNYITDLDLYKVVNDELIRHSENEIKEIKLYGRILTEEERLNILLQPTGEEIAKAESTLEILSTLQEVGLI